jgi:FkbM family methyltransferase
MHLKQQLAKCLPGRVRLPARYLYHRIRGTLERELSLLGQLVPRGHTAIDIGANWGCYTYYLSKFCRSVEAFEPIPECAKGIQAFRGRNITVHAVALSSATGERELYVPSYNGAPNWGYATFKKVLCPAVTLVVPVRTLDEYNFKDVAFLKIDVEGHELAVLEGAANTINRERPVILVEIEQRHIATPISDVFRHILRQGYRGSFLLHGSLQPLSQFSCEAHQSAPGDGPVAPREDYVNNFIFVPQST